MDNKLRVYVTINVQFCFFRHKNICIILNCNCIASVKDLQKLFIFIFFFFLDDLLTGMDYDNDPINCKYNNILL